MTAGTDQHDVIDLLQAQHQEIVARLTEVRTAPREGRREAFEQLARLVVVHESAEEQIVHPLARRHVGDAVVDARLREEDDAKTLLAELYDLLIDDSAFDTRLLALETALLHHTAAEEQQEFPALRQATDPATRRRLAAAVRAAEAVTPSRPHPQAGTHPATNLVTGPAVALYDKVRKALGDWRKSRGHT